MAFSLPSFCALVALFLTRGAWGTCPVAGTALMYSHTIGAMTFAWEKGTANEMCTVLNVTLAAGGKGWVGLGLGTAMVGRFVLPPLPTLRERMLLRSLFPSSF
jgi:hypothetical protein